MPNNKFVKPFWCFIEVFQSLKACSELGENLKGDARSAEFDSKSSLANVRNIPSTSSAIIIARIVYTNDRNMLTNP